MLLFFFFFNDTATTEIYTLSLHDALPICPRPRDDVDALRRPAHPHYLFGLLRVEKLRDCLSRVTLRTLGALSELVDLGVDRKSTRLNSSHANISYAVFCLKKKK